MSWQNLTQEQLEALPTPRLLNIYKLARNGTWCKCYCGGSCDCEEQRAPSQRIKAILDRREHVDTPQAKVTHKTQDPILNGRYSANRWSRYSSNMRRISWSENAAIQAGTMVKTKEGTVRPAFGPIKNLEEAVGCQVMKISKKPFKSKGLYNTVSGVTTNPHTNRSAFTFEEDDSIVDAHICKLRG